MPIVRSDFPPDAPIAAKSKAREAGAEFARRMRAARTAPAPTQLKPTALAFDAPDAAEGVAPPSHAIRPHGIYVASKHVFTFTLLKPLPDRAGLLEALFSELPLEAEGWSRQETKLFQGREPGQYRATRA